MADLDTVIAEIPTLVDNLKLAVGDANHLRKEIIRINNIQDQLKSLQEYIGEQLGFEKIKNIAVGALPFLGTVANFFIPGGFLIHAAISGGTTFIAEKFGNQETELSLNDLIQMIEEWIDWSNWLKEVAEDILSKSHLIRQLELNFNNLSLTAQIKEVDDNLRINLAFENPKILQKQIQKITEAQDRLLSLQCRINDVIQNIGNCEDLLKILLGLSIFFGRSGFALEWLSDEYGLIISSKRQSQALSDILSDCESFLEKVGVLISQGNSLRGQAEQALKYSEAQGQKVEFFSSKAVTVRKSGQELQKLTGVGQSLLIKALSLLVLSSGVWLAKDKFSGIYQINFSFNQEESNVANLKSAQKLAMEASIIVQNPPHSIEVWQQARLKWQQAIILLQSIPGQGSTSGQVKKQLTTYRINYEVINKRLASEQQAEENFKSSQKLAMEASVIVQNPPHPSKVWQQAEVKWQQAINLLENIPDNTSVSKQAKDKLSSYKTNYTAISSRLKN